MPTNEITECLICSKPLGQESRDMDWRLCKDHRKCLKCGGQLMRGEIHNACESAQDEFDANGFSTNASLPEILQKFLLHSRCQLGDSALRPTAEQDPSVLIKQSHLDWLNNFRLLCEPNMELSPQTNEKEADLLAEKIVFKMTLEQKFIFLSRLESAVAHVSIAIRSDSKAIKQKLDARESKKFEAATRQASTSGRAASKPENDELEILIAEFAKKNELSDVVARKLWKERSKAVQGLVKSGIPEKNAMDITDQMLRAQGRIK